MPRKVVHLARLYQPHIGGVEIHLSELVNLHLNRGDTVTVITEQFENNLPTKKAEGGLTVLRIPLAALRGKFGVWQWVWQRRHIFKNADIIHAHDVFWWLLPIYISSRKKIFTTFHGWETKFPIPLSAKFQRKIYALLSQKTIHIGAWIREFYWDRPDEITYGGVRQEVLDLQEHSRSKLPIAKITFLGRLEPDTAVPQYLRLLKILKNKGLKVQITWIGDGSLKMVCQKWGVVTGLTDEPVKYLIDADLVFASSYLSILEAQALGKLVAALYDIPLKKRYLETYPGSKYLLISNSPKNLAKQITNFQQDKKEFNKLSRQAKEFAQQQTWQKVFDTYEKIWK